METVSSIVSTITPYLTNISPTTSSAIVATGVTLTASPLLIYAAGFTSSGVAAGSLAAAVQSTIGNVAAGSIFATLQSVGVLGSSSIVYTGVGTTLAGVGTTLAGIGNNSLGQCFNSLVSDYSFD